MCGARLRAYTIVCFTIVFGEVVFTSGGSRNPKFWNSEKFRLEVWKADGKKTDIV